MPSGSMVFHAIYSKSYFACLCLSVLFVFALSFTFVCTPLLPPSMDRSTQHELEKDSADKFSSANLDGICHQLNNAACGLAYYEGIHGVDNT